MRVFMLSKISQIINKKYIKTERYGIVPKDLKLEDRNIEYKIKAAVITKDMILSYKLNNSELTFEEVIDQILKAEL